jgi:glycosyltransferase involved in cell wall biosynthesis
VTPKISVILYGYNHARYIRQAVESVLGQTWGDLELIATDNASTDGSPDILREYASRDKRIRLMLHKDNVLSGPRWNLPLREARGAFVSMINADDYYLPEKLRLQAEALLKLPDDYGLVYGPGWRFNDLTGEKWLAPTFEIHGEALRPMLERFHEGAFFYMAPLVRREAFERWPFWGDAFFEGETVFFRHALTAKFEYLAEPLVVLRDHLTNMGKSIKSNCRIFTTMLKHLADQREFPEELRPAWRGLLSRQLRNYGWQGVRVAQDPEWARSCFSEALEFSRAQALHPKVWLGWGLASLPRPALSAVNGALNLLSGHKGNLVADDRIHAAPGGLP